MAPAKRNASKKLLSNSRPGVSKARPEKTMSSKSTRALIRSHHVLQKQLKQAQSTGDQVKIASLERQIQFSGGLEAYQKASIQGQAVDRGGDSSKVLVEWLRELGCDAEAGLRLLEVGSLKVDNAIARSKMFEMVRIDLNSQHREILQQDFMERPVPRMDELKDEGFDVISLSLVVNYVPDAVGRGEMLKRTREFLRPAFTENDAMPGLFLVLPAPCVANSRYMDAATLASMMQALGYSLLKSKSTTKLVYYYYKLSPQDHKQKGAQFAKKELRQGRQLNNFAIVLK